MNLRPRRPVTLASRLVLVAVGLVAAVGLLVTATTTLVMREYLVGRLDVQVRESAERAVRSSGDDSAVGGASPDDGRLPPVEFGLGDEVGALTAVLTEQSASGWVLAPTPSEPGRRFALTEKALSQLAALPTDQRVRARDLDERGSYRLLARAVTVRGNPVVVVSGLPTDDEERAVGSLLAWQLLLTLVGVVAAALAGDRLVRRTLRPLSEVARTAHGVSELPLASGAVGETARVPEELTDPETEVGQVGAALNRLLGHVEGALDARHRSEERVRQFVADASHELRTPLSTILGYAELSRRTASYDPVEALVKVDEEGRRMQALVEDLLLLARLDEGQPLVHQEVDLTRMALETVADARVTGPGHHWALRLPEDPVVVTGDERRLHQVLSNLLTNARRHTPPGTTVTVGLTRDAERVVLTVADDGPGVPEPVQSEIFERFTRADSSRTRDSGGAGLGLALVRAIVSAHGGEVTLDSHPGSTVFTVTLPLVVEEGTPLVVEERTE